MNIIKKYLFFNIKLKLLSLLLAVMLWFAVSYMGESRMTVSVPLSFINLGRSYIIRKVDNEGVLVNVSGPVSKLKTIRSRDIGVVVDLSEVHEGRNVLNLESGRIKIPDGIKVEGIEPDYVIVDIDRMIEKRLQIILNVDKKTAERYTIKTWEPRYAIAAGSRSSLMNRYSIETFPVEVDLSSEEEVVHVALNTKGMILKSIRPDTIKVVLRRR